MTDLLDDARALLRAGRLHEADAALERAVESAPPERRAFMAHEAGIAALRAGVPALAAKWFQRAGELDPRDAEHPHSRGLAHLEAGEIGLAAQAQAEALERDPNHLGALAQQAAALEALGDDAGAARALTALLQRSGPQPALAARRNALEQMAARAAHLRLLGSSVERIHQSTLVKPAFVRQGGTDAEWRAPFATLRAELDEARLASRLVLVFHDMDASMGRSDLAYGGTTEDDDGRRVPLDEFTSSAVVFLAQTLGIETLRARRLLEWLLTPDAGLGPHAHGDARVQWVIEGEGDERRYGLSVGEGAPALN